MGRLIFHSSVMSMDLKISGTVKQVLEEQSGTGKNGPWRKQDFILETEGQYPKPVCVTQWGDKIDEFGVSSGDQLTAYIDIQSREYNGRWYTDVKAWKVEKEGSSTQQHSGTVFPEEDSGTDLPDDDELPF